MRRCRRGRGRERRGPAVDCLGRGWSGDRHDAGGGFVVVLCGKGTDGRRVVRIVLVCLCVWMLWLFMGLGGRGRRRLGDGGGGKARGCSLEAGCREC